MADQSFVALGELFRDTPVRKLSDRDRYVIFSDLHVGNGSAADDFTANSEMFLTVLVDYFERGYHLILNGDIEELLRFPYRQITAHWPKLFRLFELFHTHGRLTKLIGNHDMELLDYQRPDLPVQESIKFDYAGNHLFIFHGHQMSRTLRRQNRFVNASLKYLANPLRIKNHSVAHDSQKKFSIEKHVYEFSAQNRILSIIGHTHRPLFESMSQYDSLRFEIERLCRKYPKANADRKQRIEAKISYLRRDLLAILKRDKPEEHRSSLYNDSLVVPCMFNSGTVIGKHGMTCLEISDGTMVLRHWFDEEQGSRHLVDGRSTPTRLEQTPYHSLAVKSESLSYIFSRIRLLGGPQN